MWRWLGSTARSQLAYVRKQFELTVSRGHCSRATLLDAGARLLLGETCRCEEARAFLLAKSSSGLVRLRT